MIFDTPGLVQEGICDGIVWPTALAGETLTEEKRDDPGRQSYHRLKITCNYEGHQDCARNRNVSFQHMAHYGPTEIIGFLAVWRERAHEFLNKGMHARYCHPSHAQVKAWIDAHPEHVLS